MLEGLDVNVVDLVMGALQTYPTAIASSEEAVKRKLAVIVSIGRIDEWLRRRRTRASPGGNRCRLLPCRSVGRATIGELVRLFNEAGGIGADVSVVAMKNWRRDDWFDRPATGEPAEHKNMVAATVYPDGAIEGRTSRWGAAPTRRSSRSARRGYTARRYRGAQQRAAGHSLHPVTFAWRPPPAPEAGWPGVPRRSS